MKEKQTFNAAQDLIYLVACAVNGVKPDAERCSQMDLDEVLLISRAHSLTTAAASALNQADMLPRPFREENFKIIRRLLLYEIEREKLLAEFENRGIWYMPLKGIILKNYYPKHAFREMSDNDILCDGSKMAEVKEIMDAMNYSCKMYGRSHHDVYTKYSAIMFEMHSSLVDEYRVPKFFEYYKNLQEKLIKDEGNNFGYHLSDEDFYVYNIGHTYKHYRMAGTGLRSLLDVYMFNKKAGASLDREYVDAELKKLGIYSFERDIRRLAQKAFTLARLSRSERAELQFFIDSDCFGNPETALALDLENSDSKKAKRKYILNRIFISGTELKRKYPTVYRFRVLYPFLFVYRLFLGVTKNRKHTIKEYKGLKSFNKKDNIGKYNN